MVTLTQLDLEAPTPCVEHILAPAGLRLCRCDRHESGFATRRLSAHELTVLWATAASLDSTRPTARATADALARAAALTTGVVGLEANMGLLAELVSARDMRFGQALAVTLAVMGLESERAA